MGKICLRKDVIEIFSDLNERSGDWDSLEYTDTARSGGKNEPEDFVFHKINTKEDSDWYIAQCFVNCLYAPDGEINLEKKDNLISNNYAVKLCLEYEAIINFEEGTITIQPEFEPFLLSSDKEGNPNLDDIEMLLDFDFDEMPPIETDLPPMVCKMGKGSQNKKKFMENIMYFNNGTGPSSFVRTPLTQEESEKIYEQLGRDDIMKEDRNITMINYTEAEVTGQLLNVMCQVGFLTLSAKFLILEIPVEWDAHIMTSRSYDYEAGSPILNTLVMLKPLKKHYSLMFTTNSLSVVVVVGKQSLVITLEEIVQMLKISLKEAKSNKEILFSIAWSKKIISFKLGGRAHSLTLLEFARILGLYHAKEDLDRTTLRELIDSKDRLISDMPVDDVLREVIKRMEYRQTYHSDRYQGVFEHMAGVYNVLLQGDYNPAGYAQPQCDQYYQQYYPQQRPQYQHDDEENE
nr:hypothetical protein [Tanacetum cinerariifolium]